MIVRELVTRFGFKTDKAALDRLNRSVSGLSRSIGIIAGVGAAAAGTMFGLAKATAEYGDEIGKTAPAVGLSTDQFQKWQHALNILGVSAQGFSVGMRRFVGNVTDMTMGIGEAKEIFEDLGISIYDTNGQLKDNNTLLLEVTDALAKAENKAKAAGYGLRLFGRAGNRMGIALSKGREEIEALQREAVALGGVLSGKEVRSAEAFTDAWARFKLAVTGLKNILGVELMPRVQEAIDGFREWVAQNHNLIKQNAGKYIQGLVGFVRELWGATRQAVKGINAMAQALGGWGRIIKGIGLLISGVFAGRILKDLLGIGRGLIGVVSGIATAAGVSFGVVAAIIAAIIAAIAAVGLAIQDIYVWIRGGESLIGRWLGPWDEFRDHVLQIWTDIKAKVAEFGAFLVWVWNNPYEAGVLFREKVIALFSEMWTAIKADAAAVGKAIWWALTHPGDALELLIDAFQGALDQVKEAFFSVFRAISDFIDPILNPIREVLDKVGQFAESFLGGVLGIEQVPVPVYAGTGAGRVFPESTPKTERIPVTPSPAAPAIEHPPLSRPILPPPGTPPAAAPIPGPSITRTSSSRTVNQNVSARFDISVTAPPGSTPDQARAIADATRETVERVIDEKLRHTLNNAAEVE